MKAIAKGEKKRKRNTHKTWEADARQGRQSGQPGVGVKLEELEAAGRICHAAMWASLSRGARGLATNRIKRNRQPQNRPNFFGHVTR